MREEKITGFTVSGIDSSAIGGINVNVISKGLIKFLDSVVVSTVMMTHEGGTKFYCSTYISSASKNTSCIINRYGKISQKYDGGRVDVKPLISDGAGFRYMEKVVASKTTSSHGYIVDYQSVLGNTHTAVEKMRLLLQSRVVVESGVVHKELWDTLCISFEYKNDDKVDDLLNHLFDDDIDSLEDSLAEIVGEEGVDSESGMDMSEMPEMPPSVANSDNENWGDW